MEDINVRTKSWKDQAKITTHDANEIARLLGRTRRLPVFKVKTQAPEPSVMQTSLSEATMTNLDCTTSRLGAPRRIDQEPPYHPKRMRARTDIILARNEVIMQKLLANEQLIKEKQKVTYRQFGQRFLVLNGIALLDRSSECRIVSILLTVSLRISISRGLSAQIFGARKHCVS